MKITTDATTYSCMDCFTRMTNDLNRLREAMEEEGNKGEEWKL